VARDQVAHIHRLNRRIEQLKRELLEPVRRSGRSCWPRPAAGRWWR
jgi:hypothetical protein